MKIDKKMCKVIADLEYLIGSECYNPHSYDGWNDIEGCEFRYPVNVPDEKGNYRKEKYGIYENEVTPYTIQYIKYRFGANELYIGKGIVNILNYLERRYNLDFNELEKEIIK